DTYTLSLHDALPIFPVNSSDFSFLRSSTKPKLFVQGSADQFGAVEKVTRLAASLPGENRLVVVQGADHFFSGKLDQLDAAITTWLETSVFRPDRKSTRLNSSHVAN